MKLAESIDTQKTTLRAAKLHIHALNWPLEKHALKGLIRYYQKLASKNFPNGPRINW